MINDELLKLAAATIVKSEMTKQAGEWDSAIQALVAQAPNILSALQQPQEPTGLERMQNMFNMYQQMFPQQQTAPVNPFIRGAPAYAPTQ